MLSSKEIKEDDDSSKKEVEEVDIHEWKNEIHVDQSGENGSFTKIQDAIQQAEEKTKIVIHPGIYREHLVIENKYDIEIRSLDPEMPAIIMASNKPCIEIKNMVQGHTVKLGYLRIVHRGMREDTEEENNIKKEENKEKETKNKVLIFESQRNKELITLLNNENKGE